MYAYNERHTALSNNFTFERELRVKETGVDIRFFDFRSKPKKAGRKIIVYRTDKKIRENYRFSYPVFLPSKSVKHEKAILLLHGLNERSWNKYLSWAEFMAINTARPVILFPIAYHINRAPLSWSNPRKLLEALNLRRKSFEDDRSISFANLMLSERLSESPDRFYLSGRQTVQDLAQLFETVKNGEHPLFKEGADINIFAYSIGALLAQTSLMVNPKNLFADSRLFMFCGGSIFSSMSGASRSIMDLPAFQKLREYYYNVFSNESGSLWKKDELYAAFQKMIRPDYYKEEREAFFSSAGDRIGGVSLSGDTVIPYQGVLQAMGSDNAVRSIQLQDFPFAYTHENPFPQNEKDTTALNKAFRDIFSTATSFLM